ncbi:hypothetical protein GLOTRDRAFT_96019 [Gloeophyllum trabeum ATCC 11539]|uniref:Uncharacterized protein n=1 Tax=Gloeophyllum trabeum (strain ATCC 11539 / FP-39264 / Madison 617) TaxID=670483 RepID=S7PWJ6_GLOTA|nr:uncharacterized protein GLOTRDRAFT_96019 [Gloeophyllum trabeum ATCC 11539]EPQ51747.1 hypothetical protein GLOTRDRAFT_96019 [Gloeophyllum trabeum ATCC 11539]
MSFPCPTEIAPDVWERLDAQMQASFHAALFASDEVQPPVHDASRDGPQGDPYPPQEYQEPVIDPKLQQLSAASFSEQRTRSQGRPGMPVQPTARTQSPERQRQKPCRPRGVPRVTGANTGPSQGPGHRAMAMAQTYGPGPSFLAPPSLGPNQNRYLQPPPSAWVDPADGRAAKRFRQANDMTGYGSSTSMAFDPRFPPGHPPANDTRYLIPFGASLPHQPLTHDGRAVPTVDEDAPVAGRRPSAWVTRQLRQHHDIVESPLPASGGEKPSENDGNVPAKSYTAWQQLLKPGSKLNDIEKAAKKELSRITHRVFRTICGVSVRDPWPAPDVIRRQPNTDEEYYTPHFRKGVTDPKNTEIFDRVADVDPSIRAEELSDASIYYNRRTLYGFAKSAFEGFKPKAQAQTDIAKAEALRKNSSTTRRLARRQLKTVKRLQSVTEMFALEFNWDPSPLLQVDWVSDYASGPEDGFTETQEEWQGRMAHEAGIDLENPVLKDWTLWERIEPKWRSNTVNWIFALLEEFWWDNLDVKSKKKIRAIKVKNTGRSTYQPPATVPYDFAISSHWWKSHRDKYKDFISGWTECGNPEGYDETLGARIAEHDRQLKYDKAAKEGGREGTVDTSRDASLDNRMDPSDNEPRDSSEADINDNTDEDTYNGDWVQHADRSSSAQASDSAQLASVVTSVRRKAGSTSLTSRAHSKRSCSTASDLGGGSCAGGEDTDSELEYTP